MTKPIGRLQPENWPDLVTIIHLAQCDQWMWTERQLGIYMADMLARMRLGIIYRLLRDPYIAGEYSRQRMAATVALLSVAVSLIAGVLLPAPDQGFWLAPLFIALPVWLALQQQFSKGAPGQWSSPSNVTADGTYWRQGKLFSLPSHAREVMMSLRVFIPDARFTVRYLERDPILECHYWGQTIAVLIWDEEVGWDRQASPLLPRIYFRYRRAA